jgi:hypothetical protein
MIPSLLGIARYNLVLPGMASTEEKENHVLFIAFFI